jgi:hypothetical protein
MMAIFQNRLVLLLAGGVVVAGVVWYSFMRDRSENLLETSDLTVATEADSDIVNVLLELRAVTLSGTIFSDPAFVRLKDFGREIVPEPVGRANPFAPLPGAAAASAGTAVLQTSTTSSPTSR